MTSFWNTIKPLNVNVLGGNANNYSLPPLNNPQPAGILQPGARPDLPPPKVPPTSNRTIKDALDRLPSIFNIIEK